MDRMSITKEQMRRKEREGRRITVLITVWHSALVRLGLSWLEKALQCALLFADGRQDFTALLMTTLCGFLLICIL